MFTGIVEAVGELVASAPFGGGMRLRVSHPGWRDGLETGASVAVDGCCLTIVAGDERTFAVEVTGATRARTRFAELRSGAGVNLERPVAVGARLGGHWVQGHVDATVEVARVEAARETRYVDVLLPEEARDLVLPRGSIALDGVSLTVQEADGEPFVARVAVIPHTWAHTNLSRLAAGTRVHVEYDVLAKLVAASVRRHLEARDSCP